MTELPYPSPVVHIGVDEKSNTAIYLLEPYRVHYSDERGYIEVPVSFVSDGASIPRFFWRVLSSPIEPLTIGPSIVHDWLYLTHLVSRKEADAWYRDALKANGVSSWKANAIWSGLRIGGWTHW